MSRLLLIEGDRWVEQARNGNQEAFGKLTEAYYSRVWRFLLKWVKNRDDAEELAQETFLAAWLLGIALNLARNHHNRVVKKRSRDVELDESLYLETPGGHDDEPDRQYERKQTMRVLEEAIGRLPDDMREVVTMVKLEGMLLDEVASVLGIPAGTVKSRLSRAKSKLLEEVGPYL
jgi:RNA polymerase sigma-70 factor (ECF subfamily)